MPRIDEVGTVPRKDLHIFYVLDTSGSMAAVSYTHLTLPTICSV